jgi:hypothetical protein
MIRYYVLRKKSNRKIHTKLSLRYGKDALCQRTVDIWAARFQSKIISVEDDDKPGRPSRDDLSVTVSDYLERNLYVLCREIVKDMFVLMTTISRILEEMGWRFFIAKWMSHELSAESKGNGVDISRICAGSHKLDLPCSGS